MKMVKILWFAIVVVVFGICLGIGFAEYRIKKNLQLEMQENATLRRQVVALEEENKIFQEVFDCFTLKDELGLIGEENNEQTD